MICVRCPHCSPDRAFYRIHPVGERYEICVSCMYCEVELYRHVMLTAAACERQADLDSRGRRGATRVMGMAA